MGWMILAAVTVFLLAAGRVLRKREARQPLQMRYRTGHVQGMGEAPPTTHHRLGRRG